MTLPRPLSAEPPLGAAPHARARRPDARFTFGHPAHAIALGFGSGLSPLAPGTAGTLWAWLVFVVLQPYLSDAQWGAVIGASLLVGWWACSVTARDLAIADPGVIVWDEVVAFWIVLWLVTPASFAAQLVAFGLFRVLDAVKPGPIGWADALFKPIPGRAVGAAQGFGILFDDLVAAACTVLAFALWRFW
jgi:phosphatidylglycerophosphatase A